MGQMVQDGLLPTVLVRLVRPVKTLTNCLVWWLSGEAFAC